MVLENVSTLPMERTAFYTDNGKNVLNKFVSGFSHCESNEELFWGYYTKFRVLPGQLKVFFKYFRMIKPQNIKISTTNDVLKDT